MFKAGSKIKFYILEEVCFMGKQNGKEGAWAKIRRLYLGRDKLSRRNLRNLMAFALGGIGYTFFEEIVTTYLQFYYTEFLLVSAASVSVILSIGMIIDGGSDIIMGIIIDHFQTKQGRIRHWYLWAVFPTAIATVAIFLCPRSLSNMGKLIWLFIVYNLYCTFLTAVRMAKTTAISLCFNNTEARQQANVVSGFLNQISQTVLTSGIPLVLVALGSTAAAYTQTSIISVGIGIILILGAWYLTKEVVGSKAALENVRETEGEEAAKVIATIMENESRQPDGKKKKRNVLKDFFMLFANKYWVINMGTVLANGVGIGFMFGVATYFAKYVLGNTALLSGIYGTMSIGMMAGIFIAAPVIVKLDSRMVGVVGSFIGAAGMGISALGILVFNNLFLFYAGLFVRQIGTGFVMAIASDMTARVIDYGEWRFGYRIDGLAFSGSSVMQKIMSAAATAILGIILTAVGYQGGSDMIAAGAVSAIEHMFLTVPGLALVVSGIFYIMLNLSNKRVDEMRAEIAERAKKNVGSLSE